MMHRIRLELEEGELIKTHFSSPLLETDLTSVRGRSENAFGATGTFTWSRAVKGLTLLLLNASLNPAKKPHLTGTKGSLASSLDYAINKEPIWLSEMFGNTASGELLIKKLLLRSNSNLRRKGPLAITVRETLLIEVYLSGKKITGGALIHLLEQLETQEPKRRAA